MAALRLVHLCFLVPSVRSRTAGGQRAPDSVSTAPLCTELWSCVGSYYLRRKSSLPISLHALGHCDNSSTSPLDAPASTGESFHTTISHKMDGAVIPRTSFWQEYLQVTQYGESIDTGIGLFSAVGGPILQTHFSQTAEDAQRRREYYKRTVMFGEVDPLDLLLRLSLVSDRTDPKVGLVSQWIHTLQVFQAMKLDGVTDREFLFAGIVHDVGKLLSLVEADAYVDGCSRGLNYESIPTGGGLDKLVLLFDHHDFGADKMRRYVSPRVYRLMRYHCFNQLNVGHQELLRTVNAEERRHIPEILRFFSYDQRSKSMWVMPNVHLSLVKELVREFLPRTIVF